MKPANNNCPDQKAAIDATIEILSEQWEKMTIWDQVDFCDERKIFVWQHNNRKLAPTFTEAWAGGLLKIQNEPV